MTDLTSLDHDVAAARTVDQIRREVALRLAARAGRQRRKARRGWAHTAALWLVAGLAAALTALARRMAR